MRNMKIKKMCLLRVNVSDSTVTNILKLLKKVQFWFNRSLIIDDHVLYDIIRTLRTGTSQPLDR